MKARQAFQIGELVPENIDHFTSLIDVNQFIVNLYEFIMRTTTSSKATSCAKSSKA